MVDDVNNNLYDEIDEYQVCEADLSLSCSVSGSVLNTVLFAIYFMQDGEPLYENTGYENTKFNGNAKPIDGVVNPALISPSDDGKLLWDFSRLSNDSMLPMS